MKKKVLSMLLCSFIIFGTNGVQAFADTADSIQNQINSNNSKIGDLQNQANQVESTKGQVSDALKAIQDQLDAKTNELQESQNNIESYQKQIDGLQGKINSIEETITSTKNNIDKVEKDIEQKKQEEQEKKDLLGKRLSSAYKSNLNEEILGVILGSSDITDFIQKITVISTIIENDNQLIDEVKQMQKDLASKEKSLSAKKIELDKQKSDVETEQSKLKDTQNDLLAAKKVNEQKYNELAVLKKQGDEAISNLSDSERQIAEQLASVQEDNKGLQQQLDDMYNNINHEGSDDGSAASGQSFIKPVYGPITDDYGPRINPVTHVAGFHTGVDIGAPLGTPVKAAKSGTVVRVEWNSIYGHMVIIDHGNGVQTMYGHSRIVNVSVGQKVNQGDTICYVGSEGRSTGPHLHFEIRVNGQAQNPHNYLNF